MMDFATILLLTQSPDQLLEQVPKDTNLGKTNQLPKYFQVSPKAIQKTNQVFSNRRMRAYHNVKQPRGINH